MKKHIENKRLRDLKKTRNLILYPIMKKSIYLSYLAMLQNICLPN